MVAVANLLAAVEREVVTIELVLSEMTDRDSVARFPEKGFCLKQTSCYDRASKTPNEPEGWFTNHDFSSKDGVHDFVRIEENTSRREWVLMDQEGPGAIVRTWMPFMKPNKPNTDIVIRI